MQYKILVLFCEFVRVIFNWIEIILCLELQLAIYIQPNFNVFNPFCVEYRTSVEIRLKRNIFWVIKRSKVLPLIRFVLSQFYQENLMNFIPGT